MKVEDLRIGDLVELPFCGENGLFRISRISEPDWHGRVQLNFYGQAFYAYPENVIRHATPEEIFLWKLENA